MPSISKSRLSVGISLAALMTASQAAAQQTTANGAPIEVTVTAPRDSIQQTTAGPVRGYQALTSASGARVPTPLLELPQSVTVLPRKVLEDQGAISQSEAIQNVSGVVPLTPLSFGQLGPKVRGFAAERFVDGLPNYYDGGARDLTTNVERIEVLKGPSSILYQGGPNPVGGVVNVISRMPTPNRFATFGVTVGTNRYISPFIDVNQPLTRDGTVLFRITGQWEGTRDFIDVLNRRSYALNPSLTLTNNAGTSLTIQGHLSRRQQQDYPGLPAVGTLDRSAFSIRRTLFPGTPDIEKAYSTNQNVTLRFDHVFNETFSTFTTARIGRSVFDEPAQFTLSNTPAFAPSTFGLFNGLLTEKTTEASINSNVVGKFNWGMTRNRVLLGVDYNRVTDRGQLYADFAAPVNFANPLFPGYVRPTANPFNTFIDANNRYVQMGATVQWQSTIMERLHLLGALRLAHVDIASRSLNTGTAFDARQTKVLPRIGAAFEVTRGLSLFASYNEGLRAVPFFNGARAPRPESARQIEAGLKFDLPYGLSGSLAAFQITRRNVAVFDPANPGQQIQTGEQRARGLEADLVWQPNANWSFLGAYAYVDAVVTKDTGLAPGTPLDQVPRHSGRLWGQYTFTEGALQNLSLGVGLTGVSSQAIAITPNAAGQQWRVPGYVTVDARIGYRWQNFNLSVTAKNLADTKAFVPYPYFDGRVAPLAGRSVYATLSATF